MATGIASETVVRYLFYRLIAFALALTALLSAAVTVIIADNTERPQYPMQIRNMPDIGDLTPNWFVLPPFPERYLPIALEVEAGHSSSGQWGLWVGSGERYHTFHLRENGHFAADSVEWRASPLIQPTMNKLYLYIASNDWHDPFLPRLTSLPADYQVTLRINDEIVWNGRFAAELNSWGVIGPTDDEIDWKAIKIYTSG